MRKILFLFLILALFPLVSSAEITSCPTNQCAGEGNPYCIYYFYGQTCPHCALTAPFIAEMTQKYPDFTFHKLEIYYNSSNKEMFDDFMARYGIERAGVPAVFISGEAYIGADNIKDNLEIRIINYLNETPICPLNYAKQEASIHQISPARKIDLTLGAILGAAIVDSINPCAFAVLIFLLMYLTTIGATRRTLKIGIAYIVTVFITYFLAGLGLLTAIQSFGWTRQIFYIAAFVSIGAGLINIKDFFWYGKGITLAIPESRKPTIEKYIHKASLPAAIILGVLVSMFELPCTGGVYLAILSLIAKNAYASAIPYLLLYNFIFVIPLIIILFVVYFGVSAEKAEKVRFEKRKWLRLIMGLVMLALGLAMLFGFFG